MTVSHIITILSACDFIDDLKIIEINIEPPVQSIKVRARLKNGLMLQITESTGEDFRRILKTRKSRSNQKRCL
jgi:hypothetical protein